MGARTVGGMDKRRGEVDAYVIHANTFVMVCCSVNKVLKLGGAMESAIPVDGGVL